MTQVLINPCSSLYRGRVLGSASEGFLLRFSKRSSAGQPVVYITAVPDTGKEQISAFSSLKELIRGYIKIKRVASQSPLLCILSFHKSENEYFCRAFGARKHGLLALQKLRAKPKRGAAGRGSGRQKNLFERFSSHLPTFVCMHLLCNSIHNDIYFFVRESALHRLKNHPIRIRGSSFLGKLIKLHRFFYQ